MPRKRSKELLVEIPRNLYEEVNKLATDRDITVGDIVRLYFRTLVTANKSKAVIDLKDEMPFGKFQGETLEIIIKAEPKYVLWMIKNNERFEIAPDAMKLMEEILDA